MAFYLGSFAGGLWQGAASATQLASAYQGIRIQQGDFEQAQQLKEAQDEQARDERIDSTVSGLRTQYGTPGAETPDATQPDTTTPDAPTTPTAPVTPVKAEGLPKLAGGTTPRPKSGEPLVPAPTALPTQGAPGTQSGPSVTVPGGLPVQPIDPLVPAPPTVPQQGAPGTQSGPPATPPEPPGVAAQRAATAMSMPVATPLGSGQLTTPPSPRERQGYDPYQRQGGGPFPQPTAPPVVSPTQMPTYDVPMTQPGAYTSGQGTPQGTAAQAPVPQPYGPPAPAMPPSAQPPVAPAPVMPGARAGGLTPPSIDTGAVSQPTQANIPPPAAPPGAAGPNMSQPMTNRPIGSTITDFLGGKTQPTGPNAPGGTGGLGGRILGMIGNAIMPSAEAAETTPEGKGLPVAKTDEGTAAPAPASADKPGGATVAPAPAPVPTQDKVAPGQTQPSQQSETPAPAIAPPVNTTPWTSLQRDHPELADKVKYAVRVFGGGAVTEAQLAGHWWIESRFNTSSPDSSAGAHGIMQIKPQTARDMGAGSTPDLDPETLQGQLNLATKYLHWLAVDKNLGQNSYMTNVAYIAGPESVLRAQNDLAAEMKQHPEGYNAVKQMYPDYVTPTQSLFPGDGTGRGFTAQDVVRGVAEGNIHPDKLLSVIAETGPAGMPLSDKWRMYQATAERQMILHGHPELVPEVSNWVAQMSHAGALSNLAAGYQALAQGNINVAGQMLAKAHAFFPDGSFGKFGPAGDGKTLFAQQFDEGSGAPMGKPFAITQDDIARQMLVMQNPRNFLTALQAYRKTNAEIGQYEAHTQYYRAMPGIQERTREDAIEQRREAADARVTQQREAADQRAEVALEGQRNRKAIADQVAAGKQGNTDALEREVDKETDQRYGPATNDPDMQKRLADPAQAGGVSKEAEIYKRLRMSRQPGTGQSVSGPLAQNYASGIAGGTMKLVQKADRNGTPYYALTDKDDPDATQPRATLSVEDGNMIAHLAGSRPSRAPGGIGGGGGPQQHASAVGAGLGTPYAMQGGYGQGLAGVPTIPLPQQQPQATA
jgi:hypothetical protein